MWLIFLTIQLVVHVRGLSVIQNKDVEIDYNITYSNHCQGDTHRIQLYHGVTISHCVTECALRSHCQALNHHGQMGLCELFTEVEVDFLPGGCIHVQHNDIHVLKSPCGVVCEQGKTCDWKKNICVIKECTSFPNLANGTVMGNRKDVGMKLSTICSRNFKHKNDIKHAICEKDGIWRPRVQCSRDCGKLSTPPNVVVVTEGDTLEGSTLQYSCYPNFVHVDGSLSRLCQTDGNWNGTQPLCNEKICTSSGSCFVKYENKDLPGHDLRYTLESSFDACSTFCESLSYVGIEYCDQSPPGNPYNCWCKSMSIDDGYSLRDLTKCHYHHKL